jgi:PAS domain S-box-containing protein
LKEPTLEQEVIRLKLELERLRRENNLLKEAASRSNGLIQKKLDETGLQEFVVTPESQSHPKNNSSTEVLLQYQQLEQSFPHNQSLFWQLTQTIAQLVWITRPDGYVEYYNQQWYDYTATTPDQMQGDGWTKVLHPDDLALTLQTWQHSLNTGQPYQIEYRLKNGRSGEYHWFLGRALPLKAENGTILKWFGTCTDIDDQHKAVERLRLLGDVSAILATSLDYQTSLQKVADRLITYFGGFCLVDLFDDLLTPSFQRVAIAGAEPEKVAIAREIDHRYPPDWNSPHPLAQALRGGLPHIIVEFTDETLQQQALDEEHLVLLRYLKPRASISVPFRVRGQTIGVFSCVSSTPERFSNQQDVLLIEELGRRIAAAIDNARLYQESQQMLQTRQELDYLKDLFMSVASHELRNPLTVIKGYTEVVQNNLHNLQTELDDLPPEQLKRLERSLRASAGSLHQLERMNGLIEKLLDFSRIQNNKLELNYSSQVDLVALVEEVVEQQAQIITNHPLSLQTGFEKGQVLVQVDKDRVEQVLINLISNAVKYSPSQTEVMVGLTYYREAASIMVESNPEAENSTVQFALIWVQDQGDGIPLEEQAQLFERFYRAANSHTAGIEGLGLGLYISHEIVKQHGGQMWVESEPGQGSTFYFTLPLVVVQADPVELAIR